MEKLILSSCQEENPDGTTCDQLAELKDSYWLPGTDGRQLLHLVIRCMVGHHYTTFVKDYTGDNLSDLFELPGPDDCE